MLNRREELSIAVGEAEPSRVSAVDILLVLARGKRFWITSGIVCGLLATVLAWILPVEYRAEADILPPPQATSSVSMLMGQVGGLLGMSGGGGLGMKDPNDLIIAILKSRSVADGLIQRFDLGKVYKQKDSFLIEGALAGQTSILSTPLGVIAIRVDDRDPKLAADIANGYVDELYKQNGRLALTEAAQRRQFFDKQLATEKDALADAEVALKQTQLKTGVIALQGQTEIALRAVAAIRAQITSTQVQLQSLLTSETANNPEAIRLQEQIRALNAQLEKMQSNRSQAGNSADPTLPTASVPELSLDYVRKMREVKYHETLFELLTRQLEAAKIDESKEAPAIQVIDRAVTPHFKFRPRRTLIVVAGTMLGLFMGAVWLILEDMMEYRLKDGEEASKWSAVKRSILNWS